eukprot:2268929-Pyramimonas_sp.AAC.4
MTSSKLPRIAGASRPTIYQVITSITLVVAALLPYQPRGYVGVACISSSSDQVGGHLGNALMHVSHAGYQNADHPSRVQTTRIRVAHQIRLVGIMQC